jgi:hypothetical protein
MRMKNITKLLTAVGVAVALGSLPLYQAEASGYHHKPKSYSYKGGCGKKHSSKYYNYSYSKDEYGKDTGKYDGGYDSGSYDSGYGSQPVGNANYNYNTNYNTIKIND